MISADTEVKRATLDVLIGLYTGERGGESRSGLCSNLHSAGVAYSACNTLYKAWPEYSGDAAYPVPSYDDSKTPEDAFNLTRDMWGTGTEYGRARWRLLWWCCTELMRELGEVHEIEPPPMPLDAALADKVRALYVGAAIDSVKGEEV